MRTLTYAITHTAVFARSMARARRSMCRGGPRGLLWGAAAEEALVALFDPFGSSLAEEPQVEPVQTLPEPRSARRVRRGEPEMPFAFEHDPVVAARARNRGTRSSSHR